MPVLIYVCVFHNADYIKLLQMLVSTMAHNSQGITDLLIMTCPQFLPRIQTELCEFMYKFNTYYMVKNFNTMFESACARLHIFDYEHLDRYDKILYLDTDILVLGNFTPLFETNLASDKIHAMEEGKIGRDESNYYGGQFFDFNSVDRDRSAFTSGVMYFCNNLKIKTLFDIIKGHIKSYTESGLQPPCCLDQPFIVYNTYTQGMSDNQLMKQFLEHNPDSVSSSVIYHFSGGVGHYYSKHVRMTNFLSKILRAMPLA